MTKRKMVRVLDIEEFQRNKESILQLREEERVEQLGGIKPQPHLSDSKTLQIMSRTCSERLWGAGRDLYLASHQRTHAMVNKSGCDDLVDENISELVKALAYLVWD